jgi:hypothetical protein
MPGCWPTAMNSQAGLRLNPDGRSQRDRIISHPLLPGRGPIAPLGPTEDHTHERFSDWCGSVCRARLLSARLGTTSQPIEREPDGHAGSQSGWSGSDAVQHRRTITAHGAKHLDDAAKASRTPRKDGGASSWQGAATDGQHRQPTEPTRTCPAARPGSSRIGPESRRRA